ncbi:dihydrodipicolinate synthase family protein [Candidatus Bipolaricaulota bacterium]
MTNLRGVFVVLTTPFKNDGQVDTAGLKENVAWLVEQGVHGVIPLGSTGEFASLNDAQATGILEATTEAVDERVPIVVGAGAETTEKTISNVARAEAAGASGVLVIPPWYYTPDPDELVEHYRRIGDASTVPVMIYNNPFTSKVDIAPETLARIASAPNIEYVKESSGDIRRFAKIRELTEGTLSIFCGWEDMAYESFLMGAVGWVCVIGNVAPKLAVRLFEAVVNERDLDEGRSVYTKMLPLLRYLEYEGKTQKALKYMLDRMGLHGGKSSSPKLPLGEADKATLDDLMDGLGIERVA